MPGLNVGIFTEGGSKVGFGHLSRCLAIYDGLVQHNHQVSLHIRGDESVLKVIDNREYYLKKLVKCVRHFSNSRKFL